MAFYNSFSAPVRAPVANSAAAQPWWNGAYAAYDAKGAVSYAASLLDLTGNGRHATTGVQPGWANGTGWTFNRALGHYLRTAVYPNCDQTWSMFVKFNSLALGGNQIICGIANATYSFYLFPTIGGATYGYANGTSSSFVGVTGAITSGVMGFSGVDCYVNGVPTATIPAFPSGISTQNVYIGSRNISGGAGPEYTSAVVTSFVVFPGPLSVARVATLTTAMP